MRYLFKCNPHNFLNHSHAAGPWCGAVHASRMTLTTAASSPRVLSPLVKPNTTLPRAVAARQATAASRATSTATTVAPSTTKPLLLLSSQPPGISDTEAKGRLDWRAPRPPRPCAATPHLPESALLHAPHLERLRRGLFASQLRHRVHIGKPQPYCGDRFSLGTSFIVS